MVRDEWPFVGRDGELGDLRAQLGGASPRPLLLTGPAGVGKSWLARELGDRLAGGERTAVRLHASTALQPVPLGLLAPLLIALDVEVAGGADLELVTTVERALRERPGEVVVVDDVPHADTASVAVLAGILHRRLATVVLTAREGEALPDAVARLVDEGTVDVVTVAPFGREDTAAALRAALRGPVDPVTSRILHIASGGNPLFLRELVRGAQERGAFAEGSHGAVLTDPVPSRRLLDLLGERFARVSDEQREVLELLAAGQPLPVAALAVDVVEALEADGLVRTGDEAGALAAWLAHPIYDELLRESTPPLRWRRRLVTAAGAVAGAGDDGHMRAVSMRVAAGEPVPAEDLVRAARRAYALLDMPLARDLAEQALRAERRSDALVVLGAASSQTGEDAEAERLLREALAAAADDEMVVRAAQALGMHLAVRAGRAAEAVAVVEEARARVADGTTWADFLDADVVKWRMMSGQGPGEVAAPSAEDGVGRLNGLLIQALVAVMSGRLAEAAASVEEGLPLAEAHRDVIGHATELLLLSRFLTLVFGGDIAGGRALVTRELGSAADRQEVPVGMWRYAQSVLELHTGEAGAAERSARDAIEMLAWRDFTGLRPSARAVHATALAQLGRRAEALAALDEIDELALVDQKVAMQEGQARAWLLAADGRLDDAAALLAERAALGIESLHAYLGALTAYEAVRMGRPEPVRPLLAGLAESVEGDLVGPLAAHATALAAQDAPALVAAAGALEAIGMRIGAADALTQAAGVLERRGTREDARKLRQRSTVVAEGLDGWRAGRAAEIPALTAREREVAVLAARRHRSREIAERLGLSVRTVDNHLTRAYRKLDVVNRDGLARALVDLGLLTADDLGPATR